VKRHRLRFDRDDNRQITTITVVDAETLEDVAAVEFSTALPEALSPMFRWERGLLSGPLCLPQPLVPGQGTCQQDDDG
jgi:hypothetical protein